MSVKDDTVRLPETQQDAPPLAVAAAEAGAAAAAVERAVGPAAVKEQHQQHPFETDPGDHAETPFEAYEHLDLLLTRLAK